MPWLMWNPTAVSYLAQFVLSCTITVYLVRRILHDYRHGRVLTAMIWLTVTIGATAIYLLTCLLRSALVQAYQPYILPWVAPFDALALCALIQFAYCFPERLATRSLERYAVWFVSAAFVAAEMGVAVWRHGLTLQGHVEYRPPLMDAPIVVGVVWAGCVLLRQFIAATDPPEATTAHGLVSSILQRFRVKNEKSAAARAYLFFVLLPLCRALLTQMRALGMLSYASTEILVDWITLAELACFALIFLNYLPERSSFIVKLSGVSVTLIFATIIGLAWLMGPVYTSAYEPQSRVHSGQTYRFRPDGHGGYTVAAVPYHQETELGKRVDDETGLVRLPFEYPFYERTYDRLYVRLAGFAGFDTLPIWRETMFGYGWQPAIYALAADLEDGRRHHGAPTGGLFARSTQDRTVITWHNLTESYNPANRYTFQLFLYRDGTLDMSYIEIPEDLTFDLYAANRTVALIGITPGTRHGGNRLVSITHDSQLHGAAKTGLIDDYYLAFRRYVDRAYALVAAFVPLSLLIVLVCLPAFLRVNLLRPLNNLMEGVENFRQGRRTGDVPVTYRDEIGFLTKAFNDMARSQRDLVDTLEERVSRRTAEIAAVTARNARLEERMRLSGDLHDTVSQTLFSAAMLADILPDQWRKDSNLGEQGLARLGGLSRRALTEMRTLLTELRAESIDQDALPPAFHDLAQDIFKRYGLTVRLELSGDSPLPADIRTAFYRVAQEALNNAARHAASSDISLAYEALAGQAMLTIVDDGRGFDTRQTMPGHLGLLIMKERAERIGAVLEIDSAPARGTTLRLVWLSRGDA